MPTSNPTISVAEAVHTAISYVLGFHPAEYDPDAQLEADLDADSLSRTELAAHIADLLGLDDITPPPPDHTVAQLITDLS